jgi:hypothetical protein
MYGETHSRDDAFGYQYRNRCSINLRFTSRAGLDVQPVVIDDEMQRHLEAFGKSLDTGNLVPRSARWFHQTGQFPGLDL